jgi:hypothetical protein
MLGCWNVIAAGLPPPKIVSRLIMSSNDLARPAACHTPQ